VRSFVAMKQETLDIDDRLADTAGNLLGLTPQVSQWHELAKLNNESTI
jgi:hypothetical protein